MEFDGMGPYHFIDFLQIQTMVFIYLPLHSIPLRYIPSIQK